MSSQSISSAVEHLEFVQGFSRLCADAWERGWHEANGGNLSYRLSGEEAEELRAELETAAVRHSLEPAFPELAGELFLITASGAHLHNVKDNLKANAGIIEIGEDGTTWCTRWGLENAMPTSELATHLVAYADASERDDDSCRVVYHAHAPNALALSAVIPTRSHLWTRVLWRSMTESIIMFPQGIAAVEWMVPGSAELAERTREAMRAHRACLWAHHGIIVRATSFDDAFGTVDTIEKAAGVYLSARSASGGKEPAFLVSDDQLRAICVRYGIDANEEFLD